MSDQLPTNYDPLRVLREHEGLRLNPYRCPAGKLTIGYGRNLDDVGISEVEADMMLANDWDVAVWKVRGRGFAPNNVGAARFEALNHMVFQLGSLRDWPRFAEYMLSLSGSRALESNYAKDFAEFAADELLWKNGRTKQDRSDWWEQEEPAPNRCEKIAEIIRENRLPEEWTA